MIVKAMKTLFLISSLLVRTVVNRNSRKGHGKCVSCVTKALGVTVLLVAAVLAPPANQAGEFAAIFLGELLGAEKDLQVIG
jgi:hypothetical protein